MGAWHATVMVVARVGAAHQVYANRASAWSRPFSVDQIVELSSMVSLTWPLIRFTSQTAQRPKRSHAQSSAS